MQTPDLATAARLLRTLGYTRAGGSCTIDA